MSNSDTKIEVKICKYDNGSVSSRTEYKNGEQHGTAEAWWSSVARMYRRNYAYGKIHGLSEQWHPEGHLETTERYVNDKMHGLHEQWYSADKRFCRVNYVNGDMYGLNECWTETGLLKFWCNYVAGKKHGLGFRLTESRGLTQIYHCHDVSLSYADYQQQLGGLGAAICGVVDFSEKGIGIIIAQYCDFLPNFPPLMD